MRTFRHVSLRLWLPIMFCLSAHGSAIKVDHALVPGDLMPKPWSFQQGGFAGSSGAHVQRPRIRQACCGSSCEAARARGPGEFLTRRQRLRVYEQSKSLPHFFCLQVAMIPPHLLGLSGSLLRRRCPSNYHGFLGDPWVAFFCTRKLGV